MKMPWKIKSAVFRFIDVFSAYFLLNILQKFISRRASLKAVKLNENWRLHEQTLLKYDSIKYVLEIGAGQSLAQNFYLSAVCEKQLLIDAYQILDLSLANRAVDFLFSVGRLKEGGPLTSISDLARYGMEYRAPADINSIFENDNSFDAVISTDTFEHIPLSELRVMILDLKRIVKVGGILSFCIDYSDHYSHTDPSISDLNFLRYSESEWSRYNHSCHYQNRARHYDYRELFLEAGFSLVEDRILTYSKDYVASARNDSVNYEENFATSGHFVLQLL